MNLLRPFVGLVLLPVTLVGRLLGGGRRAADTEDSLHAEAPAEELPSPLPTSVLERGQPKLPREARVRVLSFLPLHARASLACVSCLWREAAEDASLWTVLSFDGLPSPVTGSTLKALCARAGPNLRRLVLTAFPGCAHLTARDVAEALMGTPPPGAQRVGSPAPANAPLHMSFVSSPLLPTPAALWLEELVLLTPGVYLSPPGHRTAYRAGLGCTLGWPDASLFFLAAACPRLRLLSTYVPLGSGRAHIPAGPRNTGRVAEWESCDASGTHLTVYGLGGALHALATLPAGAKQVAVRPVFAPPPPCGYGDGHSCDGTGGAGCAYGRCCPSTCVLRGHWLPPLAAALATDDTVLHLDASADPNALVWEDPAADIDPAARRLALEFDSAAAETGGGGARGGGAELSSLRNNAGAPPPLFDDAAASLFAAALRTNTTLKALALRGHPIGDPGAAALAAVLQAGGGNSTLSVLDLSCTSVSWAGQQALRRAATGRGTPLELLF